MQPVKIRRETPTGNNFASGQATFIGFAQIILGLAAVGLEAAAVEIHAHASKAAWGCWIGIIFAIVGCVGILAARTKRYITIMVYMVMCCVLGVLLSFLLMIAKGVGLEYDVRDKSHFLGVHWYWGWGKHFSGYEGRNTARVVVNALLVAIAILQLFLAVWGMALCCRTYCTCYRQCIGAEGSEKDDNEIPRLPDEERGRGMLFGQSFEKKDMKKSPSSQTQQTHLTSSPTDPAPYKDIYENGQTTPLNMSLQQARPGSGQHTPLNTSMQQPPMNTSRGQHTPLNTSMQQPPLNTSRGQHTPLNTSMQQPPMNTSRGQHTPLNTSMQQPHLNTSRGQHTPLDNSPRNSPRNLSIVQGQSTPLNSSIDQPAKTQPYEGTPSDSESDDRDDSRSAGEYTVSEPPLARSSVQDPVLQSTPPRSSPANTNPQGVQLEPGRARYNAAPAQQDRPRSQHQPERPRSQHQPVEGRRAQQPRYDPPERNYTQDYINQPGGINTERPPISALPTGPPGGVFQAPHLSQPLQEPRSPGGSVPVPLGPPGGIFHGEHLQQTLETVDPRSANSSLNTSRSSGHWHNSIPTDYDRFGSGRKRYGSRSGRSSTSNTPGKGPSGHNTPPSNDPRSPGYDGQRPPSDVFDAPHNNNPRTKYTGPAIAKGNRRSERDSTTDV